MHAACPRPAACPPASTSPTATTTATTTAATAAAATANVPAGAGPAAGPGGVGLVRDVLVSRLRDLHLCWWDLRLRLLHVCEVASDGCLWGGNSSRQEAMQGSAREGFQVADCQNPKCPTTCLAEPCTAL